MKFLEKLFGPRRKDDQSDDKPKQNEEAQEDSQTAPVQETLDIEDETVITEIPTVPVSDEYAGDISFEMVDSRLDFDMPQLIVGSSQSIGKQRDHNEDALFSLTTNLTKDSSTATMGLYIVADGMGGHKHGEIASEIAVRTVGSHVVHKVIMSLIGQSAAPPEESIQEILQDSVQVAHNAIIKDATGGGTTLTAALILGGQMTIAHVGDSRAYTISRDGAMLPLTRDHSLVMRMMELGQLSEDEAAVHPQRNVLYRALGQGDAFLPDISSSSVPETGYIFLCSDGLWGVVPEDEIIQIIRTSTNPQQACENLVDAANIAGGPDNITAILIQLPG